MSGSGGDRDGAESRSGGLTQDTAGLVRISAALASDDRPRLRAALIDALRKSDPLEVEEALLQSYLFLGYPAALNALALWREVSGREAPSAADGVDASAWLERGRDVCQAVYGRQLDRLRANVRRLHPDMETWMLTEGYGKVLGRPGLSLERRELVIVAMLAVRGPSVARQLHSHLRGALRVGASRAEVEGALELALAGADAATVGSARTVWSDVVQSNEGSG